MIKQHKNYILIKLIILLILIAISLFIRRKTSKTASKKCLCKENKSKCDCGKNT